MLYIHLLPNTQFCSVLCDVACSLIRAWYIDLLLEQNKTAIFLKESRQSTLFGMWADKIIIKYAQNQQLLLLLPNRDVEEYDEQMFIST